MFPIEKPIHGSLYSNSVHLICVACYLVAGRHILQRVLNDLKRTSLSCSRMIWLLIDPYPPLPSASCPSFSFFLSLPLCRRSQLLTGEEGKGWARSQIIQPHWSSKNHSRLSMHSSEYSISEFTLTRSRKPSVFTDNYLRVSFSIRATTVKSQQKDMCACV
jgi:hypothetical protein